MNTADAVAKEIERLKKQVEAGKMSLSDAVWKAGSAAIGWPYVYGRKGAYCEPKNRRNAPEKCQVLNESATSCDGCKWYPNGKRVRCFDCQGFIRYFLEQFGIVLDGGGCTTLWNKEYNWKAKGNIKKDGIPDEILVCLFYSENGKEKKWLHTGFGYHGQVLDCSTGVTLYPKRTDIWTHWAMPNGIGGDIPDFKPTLRKGSSGKYVTELQQDLVRLGYDVGKSGVDGKYGKDTEAAVKAFQMANGLTADGICGKNTWAALEDSPDPELYKVIIPGVTKYKAEQLCKTWPGATMEKE